MTWPTDEQLIQLMRDMEYLADAEHVGALKLNDATAMRLLRAAARLAGLMADRLA